MLLAAPTKSVYMTRAVWRDALGPYTLEQSLQTNLDFLFGNTMLL